MVRLPLKWTESASSIFDITEMRDFRIKLHNFSGTVIDFVEFVRNQEIDKEI